MKTLTIGRLAKSSGVGIETIRFYERIGLINEPPRKESGYRLYPDEAVDRILFIRRAKDLGFSLSEVRELLDLRVEPGAGAADVRRKAVKKIATITEKIKALARMKKTLVKITALCCGKGPTRDCPILDALDGRLAKGAMKPESRPLKANAKSSAAHGV